MKKLYYCAIVASLLIACCDVNRGLARKLPSVQTTPDPKVEDKDINKRNQLIVKINSANQLMVQGELIDIKTLREKAKEFILNENNADYYPEVFEEDFVLNGKAERIKYTKDHVISLQNDVDTQYQAYLEVQDELVAAYNELRDECAMKYYHKSYNELDVEDQKLIQKIYPQKISEASSQP